MEPTAGFNSDMSLEKGDNAIETKAIAGLPFGCLGLKQTSTLVKDHTIHSGRSVKVYTVNVDLLVQSFRDSDFKKILIGGDLLLADGMPIVWLSRLLKNPLPERVAGSDLIEELCSSAGSEIRMFLLGGAPGVAERASEQLWVKYGLRVAGVYCPSREEILDTDLSSKIVEFINESGANILLVGFGAPLQENWISRNSSDLETKVNIGVGATIDFLAGSVPRAPLWMRKTGLEWIYRLAREPRRLWRRYLFRDAYFIWIVLRLLLSRLIS